MVNEYGFDDLPAGYVWTSFRASDDTDTIEVKGKHDPKPIILRSPRLAVPVTLEAATLASASYNRKVTDITGTIHETDGLVASVGKSYWHAAEGIIGAARSTKNDKTGKVTPGLAASRVIVNLAAMRTFGGSESTGRGAPTVESLTQNAPANIAAQLTPEVLAYLKSQGGAR